MQGGSPSLDQYASRLYMDVGFTYCGLRIGANAIPEDSGEWLCHVSSDLQATPVSGTLDLFVANQSQIAITNPPDNEVIEYAPGSPIEAECSSLGGRPEPTFHWLANAILVYIRYTYNLLFQRYAYDDTQEIDPSEFEVTNEDSEVLNGTPLLRQTIKWSPCDTRPCDGESSFDLICKVDQGEHFEAENDLQEASVSV